MDNQKLVVGGAVLLGVGLVVYWALARTREEDELPPSEPMPLPGTTPTTAPGSAPQEPTPVVLPAPEDVLPEGVVLPEDFPDLSEIEIPPDLGPVLLPDARSPEEQYQDFAQSMARKREMQEGFAAPMPMTHSAPRPGNSGFVNVELDLPPTVREE